VAGQGIAVEFVEGLGQLSGEIDVAIVATTAAVRRTVVQQLLDAHVPRHLVLEKVLFQRAEDYAAVGELLARRGVTAWVNCPRRMWQGYVELAARLQGCQRIEITVAGSGWGLGSNAVHFIDLLDFLAPFAGSPSVSPRLLDAGFQASKRADACEVTGTLLVDGGRTRSLSLTSFSAGSAPVVVDIASERERVVVREGEQRAWLASEADKWAWQERAFPVPRQSELTDQVVVELAQHGRCRLTPYARSAELHLPFLAALAEHVPEWKGTCPVT
jgi:hypothetical protein